jgi:F-type H+-transporting ATPase subunit delta
MNDSIISVRYSRALFQLACEKKILDMVFDDMILIGGICNVDETKELLHSPVIVPSKKEETFHKLLEGNIRKETLSLIDLLVKNGREAYLPAVAREFIRQTRKSKGVTDSVLTTAVPVDEKVRKQIADLISDIFKTSVELKEVIDESIIGGFILQVDDKYIDASVKNKLRKIKKELIGSALASR